VVAVPSMRGLQPAARAAPERVVMNRSGRMDIGLLPAPQCARARRD
jgi:hypothetical protein